MPQFVKIWFCNLCTNDDSQKVSYPGTGSGRVRDGFRTGSESAATAKNPRCREIWVPAPPAPGILLPSGQRSLPTKTHRGEVRGGKATQGKITQNGTLADTTPNLNKHRGNTTRITRITRITKIIMITRCLGLARVHTSTYQRRIVPSRATTR